jgi:hypothetical protein
MLDGPYVQAAVFCENVIIGQAGTLSLINVIEGLTIVGSDPNDMPYASLDLLKVSINLWAGSDDREYGLNLRHWRPDESQGDDLQLASLSFAPQKGSLGINTIMAMPPYKIREVGTHWFDVFLTAPEGEERVLTRIPLTITHSVQAAAS